MNGNIKAIAIAIALAIPAVSFAQPSNGPLTRAQVRAQLIQLERAGYNPAAGNKSQYPSGIQAAEARVAAQNGSTETATGVGGTTTSGSESGHQMHASHWNAIYRHH